MPSVTSASSMDTGPLMAIAAGIPPHCIYVNFRQSSTYIAQGFLEPLEILLARLQSENSRVREVDEKDRWIEDPTPEEVATALAAIRKRVADPVWPVVYREDDSAIGGPKHVWSLPISNLVRALVYRRDQFSEAGLDPDRAPQTWDELLEYCRILTDPDKGRHGLFLYASGENLSWGVYSFIVSTDARAVVRDKDGQWRAGFGTRGCAEAIYMIWRLGKEPFEHDGRMITGAAKLATPAEAGENYLARGRAAMAINYLSEEVLSDMNPQLFGVAPVPESPFGARGSEVNCEMLGIFSDSTPLQKLAVMDFLWYFTSQEAKGIRTRIYVESGFGQFISPTLLKDFGYDRLLRRVPKGWQEAFSHAMKEGVPEPYGKNTQNIYRHLSEPIAAGLELPLGDMSREEAIEKLYALCRAAADRVDREVLGGVPEEKMEKQRLVAAFVLVLLGIGFAWMMISVWRFFTQVSAPFNTSRHWRKFVWGYLLLAPGLILVIWWQYIPLAAGLGISLLDFQLVRESTWRGLDNFAMVLYDERFWGGLFRTLYFVALMIGLAFWPPILLAILLQEVPTTPLKYLFRTVYYLPQVMAGVVVYFLWNQLYEASETGVLNQLLLSLNVLGPVAATILKFVMLALWGSLIWMLFKLPIKVEEMAVPLKLSLWAIGAVFLGLTVWPVISPMMGEGGVSGSLGMVGNLWGRFNLTPLRWTQSPELAMLCIVIPTVWATAGPGCILYLAALKTVPDELYEAADIDGASNWHKVFYVVLPRLKYLIMIQFIAAVIAAFKGGAEYVLVMTGGGPNHATMLLSVEIFIRTFMDLKYGIGTAMAWLLGGLLIGFTAYQLRLLSKAEFRAGG